MSSGSSEVSSTAALLESAAAKAEAAWAILADRKCKPEDAAPLLELGFLRLAAGLNKPFASLASELAGVDAASRERLARCLEALAAQGSSVRERDAQLARADLDFLAATLGTTARAALRASQPRSARAMLMRRAPLLIAVAAFLAGIGALAVPRKTVETGWRGTYYKAVDFKGASQVQRDPSIQFFWDKGAPLSGFPNDNFTVRWDGCLRVDKDGTARFSIGSDDMSRLFVDGHRVVDNWVPHSLTFANGQTVLKKGLHWVRVEYEEQTGDAAVMLKLGWDGSEPKPVDPWKVLYPSGQEPDPCASLR